MPDPIIVLDGYTLTPAVPGEPAPEGEPSWDPIAAQGKLTVHDRTPDERVVERASGVPIVLTNKTPLTAETLAALPELRYVGVLATGTNVVDLDAAKQCGVVVTNVPGYGPASVAQHTFALLLALVNRVAEHDAAVRKGQWQASRDFCFTVAPLTELAGKTLGIVGLGAIGRRVARIADAFGMHVLAASRRTGVSRPGLVGFDVAEVTIDELLERADAVTLHCPLTPQTHHLLNADRLRRMKPTAYLLNTGRGPLIDEAALARALEEGWIAGAGLDVLSSEPPADDHPLLHAPRCLVTPHIAWATREARARLLAIAAENLRAFLAGEPRNVVNP